MKTSFVSLLLILGFTCISCKENLKPESETATQDEQETTPSNPDNHLRSEIYKIVKMSCQKISSCQPLADFQTCMMGQIQKSSYGSKLGLSFDDQQKPLWELVEAEGEERIVPDASNAILCINLIDDLSCDDDSIAQAFNPSVEEPYGYVSEILPATCQSVFNF